MDDVIADTMSKILRVYNEAFGESVTAADIERRSFAEIVPPARGAVLRDLVLDPTFFGDLEVVAGSPDVVRELTEHYEVFIASAAMEVPTSFAAKYAWLRRHFDFIPDSHLVFCGDKAVLDVDVLIDDTVRHFERFRGRPVLFSAPHNVREERFFRVRDWEEVRRIFLGENSPSNGGPALSLATT
jgi:5'(3')-deoxyribonucleotidase